MPPAAHAHLPDGGEQGGVVGREREGRVLVRRSGARALGGKLQRERLDAAGTPLTRLELDLDLTWTWDLDLS